MNRTLELGLVTLIAGVVIYIQDEIIAEQEELLRATADDNMGLRAYINDAQRRAHIAKEENDDA